MSDFNGSKPVQTVRDDEFKIKLVDGQSGDTASKVLTVATAGDALSAGVNDFLVPISVLDKDSKHSMLLKGDGGGLKTELIDAEGDELLISDDGEALVRIHKAQGTDGATAPTESIQIAGKDASGNLQTVLTDTDGKVYVVPDELSGKTKVFKYDTTASGVPNTPVNHDYLVTSGKTFYGKVACVGARGALKVQIGTYDGVSVFTPFMTYFQDPKENIDHNIESLVLLGDGTVTIRVIITNLDQANSDVYSTIQGFEI
jgi:hypothetical protein